MSTSGSRSIVLGSLLANVGITLVKLVALVFSGSSALVAEAVHSLAQTGSQLAVLLGVRRPASGRPPLLTAALVTVALYAVGGAVALYEGVDSLLHPRPLSLAWLALAALGVALVVQALGLRAALRAAASAPGATESARRAARPGVPVLLVEHSAGLVGLLLAAIGVALTLLTGDPLWDAAAACIIGVLLLVASVVLGLQAAGLAASSALSDAEHDGVRSALVQHPEVVRVLDLETRRLAEDEILVTARIDFGSGRRVEDVASAIDVVAADLRDLVPAVRVVYLEPGIDVDPNIVYPPTDAIVIKGAD